MPHYTILCMANHAGRPRPRPLSLARPPSDPHLAGRGKAVDLLRREELVDICRVKH